MIFQFTSINKGFWDVRIYKRPFCGKTLHKFDIKRNQWQQEIVFLPKSFLQHPNWVTKAIFIASSRQQYVYLTWPTRFFKSLFLSALMWLFFHHYSVLAVTGYCFDTCIVFTIYQRDSFDLHNWRHIMRIKASRGVQQYRPFIRSSFETLLDYQKF